MCIRDRYQRRVHGERSPWKTQERTSKNKIKAKERKFPQMLNSFRLGKFSSPFARRFFSTGQPYDVAIIGGGPGGYVAAIKAAQLGLKTVCIEKRGALGGTCLNVGCIPSKALLNITHKFEDAQKHFADLGINVSNLSYDFGKMMVKKEKIVSTLTRGIEGLFTKNKVDYLKGAGRLVNNSTVDVKLNDGSSKQVNAKNIIIATGSEPVELPGIPFDEKTIVSSTGALVLEKVPKKLIVIGAGYIGLEMGSVFRRLGTEVLVLEYADRVVPILDSEIATHFHRSLIKQGIKFQFKTKVTGARNTANGVELQTQPAAGGATEIVNCDVLLVATGRRAYTQGLGAKEAGVNLDKFGKVVINDKFQTNIPNIYAIGDVAASKGPMLAHRAEEEGIACVEYLAGHEPHVNYETIPGVVYTHPEVATVGKTEDQLKAEGREYSKGTFPFLANSRAKANDDTEGLVKVLTDKKTDRILGIHIIGPHAGEMLAEGVLGMEYGASSEDISRTCHSHPTLSEALKEACLAAHFKPIHMQKDSQQRRLHFFCLILFNVRTHVLLDHVLTRSYVQ
eukprot:TRINITY_DN27614_c0_g1_i1.p1 TRINITY_DN27614_c0_g1~~TRINITY_DN27614_c0_g1_i1.p1  ORF type:complete len:588 (-),score=225.22 TRINITY_DN27614_c0_g1_i1:162-1853(-)